MAARIHVGDVGIPITVTFKDQDGVIFPINGATTKEIWLSTPTGTTSKYTGSYVTDGTDAKLRYILQANNISVEGA